MLILEKKSALGPIAVNAGKNTLKYGLGMGLGAPLLFQQFGGMLWPDNPISKLISQSYGKIPFLGKHLYGGVDEPERTGLEKIKDPSVRSQLMRKQDGSYFSPNGWMHGNNAIKHHLISNISASEADRNNPLFKNIRELSTGANTREAWQKSVEEGRTANVNFDNNSQNRLMSNLSKGQKREVAEGQGRFLDSMVGAVIGTDNPTNRYKR